jgi:hypothetical protein
MLNLRNVTLLGICGNKINETHSAINHCNSIADFAKTVIITDQDNFSPIDNINYIFHDRKIDLIEYSKICINNLSDIIDSDFVLLVQWDGFIIDTNYWTDQFFEYDYIGAPWGFGSACKNRVGNGGFSLRSKKFLDTCKTIEYHPYDCDWFLDVQKISRPIAPEDWFMCYNKYEYLLSKNIKFPSIDLAYKFSIEHPSAMKSFDRDDLDTYKSFGFHGNFNKAGMNLL